MNSKSTMKIDGEEVHIDPQLLFQRLVIAGTQTDDLSEAFKYELCSYPPALFEKKGVFLAANKPALAKVIWDAVPTDDTGPVHERKYVLDGGAFLHRIPWEIGTTYNEIIKQYTGYVTKRYGAAVVVFDGYHDGPTTKDAAHDRRTGGYSGRKVTFTEKTTLRMKKTEFLSNPENKQTFIDVLTAGLKVVGCEVHHAKGDADTLIVEVTIATAKQCPTVLVGDDTDLLILLCHHAQKCAENIYFMPEPKKESKVGRRYLNIHKAQDALGQSACQNILFVHAVLGCDTTSRVFGIGKPVALKRIKDDTHFIEQARVFLRTTCTQDEVTTAREKALVSLYKGRHSDDLNTLRLTTFQTQVTQSKKSIHPRTLPPTAGAAKFHSLRVYHQVQSWKGNALNPEEWGWRRVGTKLTPVQCDVDAAPKFLLELIRCKCKSGCGTMRCPCRRQGLECSLACSECRGVCNNMSLSEETAEDSNE